MRQPMNFLFRCCHPLPVGGWLRNLPDGWPPTGGIAAGVGFAAAVRATMRIVAASKKLVDQQPRASQPGFRHRIFSLVRRPTDCRPRQPTKNAGQWPERRISPVVTKAAVKASEGLIVVDVASAMQQHFARIRRAALALAGNPWDADDLAQETFLVMAAQGDRFQGRSSLYTWLYGILLNLDRRERRRQGLRRRKLRVLWDESAHASATPLEPPWEVAEWRNSLWSYVARLPDGQRQALILRFSEHLSYDEVAEVLGCPLGTVKSRIFNGLHSLKQMLANDMSGAAVAGFPPQASSLQPKQVSDGV